MTGAGTASTERILAWDGCFNARDTGGLAAGDGASIRRGALARSDVLSRLTPVGVAALRAHGVRTVVDVRSAHEVALDWHAYPFRSGGPADSIAYLNVPFHPERDERVEQEVRARYAAAQSREELNRIDLDTYGDGIAAIVAAIADAPPGGVLVHCHAGKDRTGLVVALALSVAGVSDEDIADDYALTMLNLEPLIAEWLDELAVEGPERERLRGLAAPRREAMLDTLAYLRERYGSAEAYLERHGLTREQLARLKQRLVDG